MYVFDAYGTLLDVDAAAREASAEPGMEALKDHWAQTPFGIICDYPLQPYLTGASILDEVF